MHTAASGSCDLKFLEPVSLESAGLEGYWVWIGGAAFLEVQISQTQSLRLHRESPKPAAHGAEFGERSSRLFENVQLQMLEAEASRL